MDENKKSEIIESEATILNQLQDFLDKNKI